ncbi:M15 family metallopeptidase [Dactylosporangium sp. NPDC051541]|uniref:M15 family metallopeptidase n=1 Tax=Dactylosporangium sp. NPDC051541 TaxID=3363977 RepID=UPI0037998602
MRRAFPTNPAARRAALGIAAAGLVLLAAGCAPTPRVAPAPAGVSSPAAPTGAGTGSTPAAVERIPEDSIEPLPAALRESMTGVSWRPGCPVGLDDLRLVHVSYVDFDGVPQPGQLVVHQAIADATLRVFQRLRDARFPIRSMNLIERYGGSDDESMAADNTSGFNCRNVPNTEHWSNHAYGRAIDVNTVENPYLPRGQVMPPAGNQFLDRGNVRKGMIIAGDATVRAFRAEGFSWGGAWKNGTDYQHFEKA